MIYQIHEEVFRTDLFLVSFVIWKYLVWSRIQFFSSLLEGPPNSNRSNSGFDGGGYLKFEGKSIHGDLIWLQSMVIKNIEASPTPPFQQDFPANHPAIGFHHGISWRHGGFPIWSAFRFNGAAGAMAGAGLLRSGGMGGMAPVGSRKNLQYGRPVSSGGSDMNLRKGL